MPDGSQEVNETPLTPDTGEDTVGLTEVDPSPVHDTPSEFKEDYFVPSSLEPARTSTLGLGNHGLAYYLVRAQKYSSYAFTVFASLHIANTSVIPLFTQSVPESNRYLLLTRPYYQSAITEPLLVALPLVTHIASGVALRFHRRRQALKRYGAETHQDRRTIPWPSVSGTSILGYALLPLAGYHVLTTRLIPLYMHGDNSLISLSYISHGVTQYPVISFAGFTALIGVGAWHTVWGLAKWLGLSPTQVTEMGGRKDFVKKRRWYGINLISALVAGLWWAGGMGIIARDGKTQGWIGREYDELYKNMPLLGWLK
ncbi:hypothetical protein GQ43DRAFT_369357 [Delitschia confertaspora ATCC 74209]|uniref:Mitochondrial adapter protein MCP1 transmembrane domain-containing protein n=1 Tax=Delitschia confertaspora ATCC 74209 TaxID=1513339 RepID=A0A9P4JTN7_9PLEO|nr:hypothetical protein GQ43DRAFT_369357 [Delitschia confertaspora ATCC 74209]